MLYKKSGGKKKDRIQIFGFKYDCSNMIPSNMIVQILSNGDPFENFGYKSNAGRSSSVVSLLSPRVNSAASSKRKPHFYLLEKYTKWPAVEKIRH